MSQSVDPDHFFQTSDSLAERERKEAKAKNNNGDPIRLPSKVLALIADPESPNRVYVSESGGAARRIDLNTRSISHSFTGPSAPLPCLTLSTPKPTTLYAGCWDKNIYSWDTRTRKPLRTFHNAHGDFVKALAFAHIPSRDFTTGVDIGAGLDLLISGGADRAVNIFNAATGERLANLRGHGMGVLSVVLDPVGLRPDGGYEVPLSLFSASSDREIRLWEVQVNKDEGEASGKGWKVVAKEIGEPLMPHPTTVHALLFTPPPVSGGDNDTVTQRDLLACSASGSVALLSRTHGWTAKATYSHGEQNGVRCLAASLYGDLVASGGRDEDVWLWEVDDDEQNPEKGRVEKVGKWKGHADEVMGLVWLGKGAESRDRVVSGSLDGTVRVWENGGRGKGWVEGDEEEETVEFDEKERKDEADEKGEEQGKKEVELTAEEEAELAELMDDDD